MKYNKLKISSLSALCIAAVFNVASATELTAEEDYEMALLAMPELADDVQKPTESSFSAAVRMKCYVDTPAYDQFRYGNCFSAGFARTTTAVFRVDNVPAGSTIIWSNSNCSASSTCFVPIRQYQTINVSATVLKPNGTYEVTSATAHYEGMF